MTEAKREQAVIVCAENAILFGYATPADITRSVKTRSIRITRARWAYRWHNKGGHMGLAATGPQSGSRVGAVGTVLLHKISCVIDATEGAAAWDAYPVSTS